VRDGDLLRAVRALLVALAVAASPARAALLSSVQTGTATSTGPGIVAVAIAAVDTTKSFLVFQTRSDSDRPVASYLRGRLASSTSIEFERASDEASPLPVDIQWYVASFASGVRVQRGEVAQSAVTIDVPIAAVGSLAQAFVLWSKSADPPDQNWGMNDPVVGELTTTTNLQFRVNLTNANHFIAWQVIEFTNAAEINVQKGSIATMTGATTSVTATLSPAVDPTRTFVLASFRSASSTTNVGARLLRAQLTNPTTITIDRSTGGAGEDLTEVTWQAVELKDGTHVEGGSASFAAGVAQQVVSLAVPVDPRRAVAFASVQPAGGQAMGRSPYVGDDVIGVASFTLALSPTDVTLDRNSTLDAADVGWFVLQFRTRRVMVTDD